MVGKMKLFIKNPSALCCFKDFRGAILTITWNSIKNLTKHIFFVPGVHCTRTLPQMRLPGNPHFVRLGICYLAEWALRLKKTNFGRVSA
jgi:hypothetical protein